METTSPVERLLRGVALTLVVVFFMFPIVWIFLMSFQTNETILRIPPSVVFTPTLENYAALITGKLQTASGTLDIAFMRNLGNSVLLSVASVALALVLACRRPMPSLGTSSGDRRTLPSRSSPSALRRHCSCCCP